jgi:hypothetical protein
MDLHGGMSGREMMLVLIDRVADRVVSAELAKPRLRAKLPQLHQALTPGSAPSRIPC